MHGFFPLFYLAAVQAPATGRLESEKKNFYSSRGERVSVSRFSCAHLSSIRIIARARPAREVTNRPPRAQLPRHAGRQRDRVEHPQLLARHELGSSRYNCNKESLQVERAWKEHAGKGNTRQRAPPSRAGSQTGAYTPTRGVHITVRTALAQGGQGRLTHNRVSHTEPRRRRRSSGHHTVSYRAFRPFFSHFASFFHPPPDFGRRLPSFLSCTRHLPGVP